MQLQFLILTLAGGAFAAGCGAASTMSRVGTDEGASSAVPAGITVLDERTPTADVDPCAEARAAAWPRVEAMAVTALLPLDADPAEAADDSVAPLLRVDASAGGMQGAASSPYVYLNLTHTRQSVALSDVDAATSPDWHVALKRTQFRVNSGDSGVGQVRMARIHGTWDEVIAAPEQVLQDGTLTWATDRSVDQRCEVVRDPIGQPWTAMNELNADNPSGSHSWYLYGPDGVSVAAETLYLVHDVASSSAWLVEIVDWQDGVWTLRWHSLADSVVRELDPS